MFLAALDFCLKVFQLRLVFLLVLDDFGILVIDHSFLVLHDLEHASDGRLSLLLRDVLFCLVFEDLVHIIVTHQLRNSFGPFCVLLLKSDIQICFF